MPIFWTEERGGLPYTEIRVGALTLCFRGRFGSKLREAVKHLEQQQKGASHGAASRAAGSEGQEAAEAEAEERTEAMKIEGFASRQSKDGGAVVVVDGKELPLAPSLRLRNHSPTGFQWGYGGSGPAQLALALLLFAGVEKQDAEDLYQAFKFAHVARWPNGQDFKVEIDIKAWVLGAQAAGRALRQSER